MRESSYRGLRPLVKPTTNTPFINIFEYHTSAFKKTKPCDEQQLNFKGYRGFPVRIFDVTQNFHKIDYFNAHGTTVSR
jgi:hypothetical protein